MSRLPLWPLWTACLWVAEEAARGRFPYGGFAWARLGLSQTSGPLLALAAYGGVPLVSLAVALVGTLLAAAVLAPAGRGGRRRRGRAVAAAATAGALVGAGALAWLPLPGPSPTAGGPARTVAVIQGDVPRLGLDFNAQRRAVLDDHVATRSRLADEVTRARAPSPTWSCGRRTPATSTPAKPRRRGGDLRGGARIGAPILVGAVLRTDPGTSRTPRILWPPGTGPGPGVREAPPGALRRIHAHAACIARLVTSKVDLVENMLAGTLPGCITAAGPWAT